MPAQAAIEFDVFRRELLLAPRQVRVRVLESIEELIAEITSEKTYPFDYVVFRVTAHRPESVSPLVLSAEDAERELAYMLYEVGRSVTVAAESISEQVLSVEEVASKWKVSPATVLRWRREGLALRLFRFETGRRRAGVRKSLVAKFEAERAKMIRHARTRRRLSTAEYRTIVEDALVGLAREESPGRVLAELSRRFVLRQATIERLLSSAARENLALAPFTPVSISRRESEQIFDEVSRGLTIAEIAESHGRSPEGVRRAALRVRAKRIAKRNIRFVASDEFASAGAEELIINAASDTAGPRPEGSKPAGQSGELPLYLKGIADAPLLAKDEEWALFRKYNYLKFQACELRRELDQHRPDEALMVRIEKLLAHAERVRNRIVRANLRLVASIAKRHYSRGANAAALISDGNMALLDAVEAFDYSRGNRFSTYAGWAIIRRFARTLPETHPHVTSIDEEILESTAKIEVDYTALAPAVIKAGVSRALANLSDREREVLESRFGLGRHARPLTLAELGAVFGVTKERIRQIEIQALSRLKRVVESTAPELMPE
jgi:RNA polymerase sigma factor (sigma-70 family)